MSQFVPVKPKPKCKSALDGRWATMRLGEGDGKHELENKAPEMRPPRLIHHRCILLAPLAGWLAGSARRDDRESREIKWPARSATWSRLSRRMLLRQARARPIATQRSSPWPACDFRDGSNRSVLLSVGGLNLMGQFRSQLSGSTLVGHSIKPSRVAHDTWPSARWLGRL